jgi:hypothetical protein
LGHGEDLHLRVGRAAHRVHIRPRLVGDLAYPPRRLGHEDQQAHVGALLLDGANKVADHGRVNLPPALHRHHGPAEPLQVVMEPDATVDALVAYLAIIRPLQRDPRRVTVTDERISEGRQLVHGTVRLRLSQHGPQPLVEQLRAAIVPP